ncbi:MAG TPA: SDR family oxidoreductase [Pseudonocardiaceae bacterium]|jgi:3-hydroxybutyrate dehydrogenase/3-oxoacyl-[acyl-carrier protein] reductase
MGVLEDRVAAITSGSTGIGKGIAEAFLAEGAKVVINGRNADKGARALKELDAGERGHFIQGDVTIREDVDRLIDGTVEKFGKIDILVNNAGGLIKTAPVKDLSDEDWDYAVRWNLYSAFWATRRALNYMEPQGWGRIINISSVEGKHGKAAIPAYVASKHALSGLTKAVSKEAGTTGVTCNAICPGLVWTDVLVQTGPDSAKAMGITFDQMVDQFAQETALKRITTVEEVAAVAVLLASPVAAGITGAMYNVDGGTAAY